MRAEDHKSALEPPQNNPYLAFKAKLWVLAVSIWEKFDRTLFRSLQYSHPQDVFVMELSTHGPPLTTV